MESAASVPASPLLASTLPAAISPAATSPAATSPAELSPAASPADELMAHVPDLRRCTLMRCGDFHLAEDVAHEAALTALIRMDQLKDPMRLRPWMFTIARRRLADSRRRSRFESPLVEEPPVPVQVADNSQAAAVKVAAMLAGLAQRCSA